MTFDDGSTLDLSTGQATDAPSGMLLGDVFDQAHMGPVQAQYATVTGQPASVPWWEQAIQYGLVRAIDNRFGPVNTAGNVNPGTFAGANGRTYVNANGKVVAAGSMLGNPLLLLALGGLVIYLATRG